MSVSDCHTHRFSTDAIISAIPGQQLNSSGHYSIGIHPWNSNDIWDLAKAESYFTLPEVIAVGECGLDPLHGADPATQLQLLEQHIRWSEQYQLPLILHCVKSASQIIALKKSLRPTQPWIIHGFRLNAHTASMLMNHDIYLSTGQYFNPEALRLIPDGRLLIETDDSPLSIRDIAIKTAKYRDTDPDTVLRQSADTINRLFSRLNT